MNRLSNAEIAERLKQRPEWKGDKAIQRRYRFTTFPNAIAFVNEVAEIAEQKNHHPFISIDYKLVTIRLTTWHEGGITDLDFDQAAILDNLYSQMIASFGDARKPE